MKVVFIQHWQGFHSVTISSSLLSVIKLFLLCFSVSQGVKKDRVSRVAQNVFDNGKPDNEKRGGARDTDEMKARKESSPALA